MFGGVAAGLAVAAVAWLVLNFVINCAEVYYARDASINGPTKAEERIINNPKYTAANNNIASIKKAVEGMQAEAAGSPVERMEQMFKGLEDKLLPAKAQDFGSMVKTEMQTARRAMMDQFSKDMEARLPTIMDQLKASIRTHAKRELEKQLDAADDEEAEFMEAAASDGVGGGIPGLADMVDEVIGPHAGAVVRGGNKFLMSEKGKDIVKKAKAAYKGGKIGGGGKSYAGPPPGG